jgi:hypothetical protein
VSVRNLSLRRLMWLTHLVIRYVSCGGKSSETVTVLKLKGDVVFGHVHHRESDSLHKDIWCQGYPLLRVPCASRAVEGYALLGGHRA